jgi:signal transduction histidine kinase
MRLVELIRTTTFLLTLRYMVLFFLSVTILLSFINWSTIGYIKRQADATIEVEITGLAEHYRQRGLDGLVGVIAQRINAAPEGAALYLFADPAYQPLAGNLDHWPQLTRLDEGWAEFEHSDGLGKTVPARVRVFTLPGNLHLLVGRDIPVLQQLTALFDRVFLWGLGVTLALALSGGLLMSGNVVRRVNAINTTSRRIIGGDLSQRIATRGTRDEFDELANNLNAMLDQIESLMHSIQHMSDNVAHDLRTPLTRLRNRLEELRRTVDDEARTSVDACLEDADALLATFAALLRIARIESGTPGAGEKSVALGEIVQDACELYQALAEDKSIKLRCQAVNSAAVKGDRDLIFQALVNLLDNAIKYTPTGGAVTVSLADGGNGAVLEVCDSGPGIPPEMRDKVLQRFFRLDMSRSQAGVGLGLSLVQAVARRHGARLSLRDNAPGLCVRMEFPPGKPRVTGRTGAVPMRAAP